MVKAVPSAQLTQRMMGIRRPALHARVALFSAAEAASVSHFFLNSVFFITLNNSANTPTILNYSESVSKVICKFMCM